MILDSIKLTVLTKVQQSQIPMSLPGVHLLLRQEMSLEELEVIEYFVSGHVMDEESQ